MYIYKNNHVIKIKFIILPFHIDDSEFEQEALTTHNNYRKTHGVPEMILDRDLSNQAKGYAQKIANMGQMIHSSREERGKSIGENLAYACASNGTPLTGKSATKMWYDIYFITFYKKVLFFKHGITCIITCNPI